MTEQAKTQLSVRGESFHQTLVANRAKLAQSLPSHINPDRFIRMAVSMALQYPDLLKCTTVSVMQALNDCARLGCWPGPPLGEAWLLPFRDNRSGTSIATFCIGYKGLAKLMWQSGSIESLDAEVVHEGDFFDWAKEYGEGVRPWLKHKPSEEPDRDRKPITHAWAAVTIRGGGYRFRVMSVNELNAVRDRTPSARKKSGPWFDPRDYPAMCRKTVFKRVAELCPLSTELRTVVERDNQLDLGEIPGAEHLIDPPPVEGQTPENSGPGEEQTLDDVASNLEAEDK